jgi:hypothetical protein
MVPMNNSRQQDHVRQHVFIHGANVAHFLSLLGRETDEAKRATILKLVAEEREKEKTSWDLTTGRASQASLPPAREPESILMTAHADGRH